MTIEEILAKMQAMVDAAEAENRAMSDEEVTAYESLEKDLKATNKTVELRARQIAYKTPITSGIQTAAPILDGQYERAFSEYIRTGQRNSDLVEMRAQGEAGFTTSGSTGGYEVPTVFRAVLIEKLKAFIGFSQYAEQFTTGDGRPVDWPSVDDTANTAEIVAEGASAATAGADLTFGTATLGAWRYTATGTGNLPVRISQELLQDAAFDVQAQVTRLLGIRIGRKMNHDFAVGTGSSQPLGLFHEVADVALASASNSLTYNKLMDTVHTVDPAYRQNCRWVFNDSTLKACREILDLNGRPIWMPSTSGIDQMPGGSLLGYPVVIDPSAPIIQSGTHSAGDAFCAFGDIQQAYVVRNVQAIAILVDPYSYAKNGQIAIYCTMRADGTVQQRAAYALLEGYHS
jgi:HK97 family phage major capsid protein